MSIRWGRGVYSFFHSPLGTRSRLKSNVTLRLNDIFQSVVNHQQINVSVVLKRQSVQLTTIVDMDRLEMGFRQFLLV